MSRSNKSANSHHSGGSNSSSSRVPQQHVTTTLHSIESHGSVGTNRGTGAYFHQSAAERKLELLESRVFPVGHSPLTATSESTSFQPSFSQSPHTHSQQQQRQQRHLKPFHSFGFDSPTMDLPATHGGSTHQGALLLRTRSKRGLLTTSTLDQVRLATDRHLQKVAAAAATTTTDPHGLVVASSSCSEVSSESSTRLLHNRSTGREPPPQQPPVQTEEQQQEDQPMLQQQQQALSSTTEPQSTNGGVATIAAEGDQTPSLRTPPVVEPTKKRKSVPVKVEEPSVKENVPHTGTTTNRNNALRPAVQRALATSRTNQLKASKSTAKQTPKKGPQPNNTTTITTTTATTTHSSSAAVVIKEEGMEPPSSHDPLPPETTKPRVSIAATPRRPSPKKSLTPRSASASRDGADSKKARLHSTTQPPARAHPTLYDFFPSTTHPKRRKVSNQDKVVCTLSPKSEPQGDGEEMQQPQAQEASVSNSPKARLPRKSSSVESTSTANANPALEKRIQELEQTCRDKEEQLKAVANNRTILHTALQAALDQRDKELKELKERQAEWESRSRTVLEEFVLADATRTARVVRERLAADGARLGRLVYSRGGIRSAPVENWEEGHAICSLVQRKSAWREKRKRLESRYRAAQKQAHEWLSPPESPLESTAEKDPKSPSDTSQSSNNNNNTPSFSGDMPVRTKMDAMQALESARFHLENLRKEERELLAQEQKLNDEKGAHIRALKRVASEDASRFRTGLKMHARYVLKCLLGKGGFSEVWRAFDLVELREVAVKIHQLDPRWSESKKENYTKHVSREYEIHRNVRHPRIVSLFDVFEIDNNSFATVLEFCEGTDLDTMLKEKRRLPERDAKSILLQILSGMQYLSQPSEDGGRQGIIHYDLKPGNILFDEFGDAKITDFGLSKIVDAHDPAESMELTSQGAGTYWYLPPECFVMDETVRISNKVDVWSIGVIFYQMLFGKRPFGDGQSQDSILSNRTMLNAHQVPFPDRPAVSEECKTFIRTCLAYDQTFRPTMAQLCEHAYVTTLSKRKS